MPGGLVFIVLVMRRELAAGRIAEADGPEPAGPGPGARSGAEATAPRPVKARKVRIWDEEDA